MKPESFEALGYAIVPGILPPDECDAIAARVGPGHESVGSRSLLTHPWCIDLAARLRHHPALSTLIGADDVAVQCTYFEKSAAGAALVLRPLLLHASSKASGESRRRVLHFLFAPADPPNGLRWQHAA